MVAKKRKVMAREKCKKRKFHQKGCKKPVFELKKPVFEENINCSIIDLTKKL